MGIIISDEGKTYKEILGKAKSIVGKGSSTKAIRS